MGELSGETPLNLRDLVHNDSIVYDLIYTPEKTVFLRQAQAMGLLTINGWPMLLHQAAKSFEIWSGLSFPQEVLQELLNKPIKPPLRKL